MQDLRGQNNKGEYVKDKFSEPVLFSHLLNNRLEITIESRSCIPYRGLVLNLAFMTTIPDSKNYHENSPKWAASIIL